MWENVKDVANAALPYIPTYPLGYGMAVAQNTLPQIKDTISNAYNIYKKGGLYALGKQIPIKEKHTEVCQGYWKMLGKI